MYTVFSLFWCSAKIHITFWYWLLLLYRHKATLTNKLMQCCAVYFLFSYVILTCLFLSDHSSEYLKYTLCFVLQFYYNTFHRCLFLYFFLVKFIVFITIYIKYIIDHKSSWLSFLYFFSYYIKVNSYALLS